MSNNSLSDRKSAIEQRYNELDKHKNEIEAEMRRLEGEHRLITELVDALVEHKPKRIRKDKGQDHAQD